MTETKTANDAEELADRIGYPKFTVDNPVDPQTALEELAATKRQNIALLKSALTSAEQRGFERGQLICPRYSGQSVLEAFDTTCVDNLAFDMKIKMDYSREVKGRSGWFDKNQCTVEQLSSMLRSHIEKGDPVDVANFCMMLHHRKERICAAPQADVVPAPTIVDWHLLKEAVDFAEDENDFGKEPKYIAAWERLYKQACDNANVVPSGDAETYAERRNREHLFKKSSYIRMRKKILSSFEFREPKSGAWNEQFVLVENAYRQLMDELPDNLIEKELAAARAEGERIGFERAVSEGWQLVPKEPPEKFLSKCEETGLGRLWGDRTYKAMLAAAPLAPKTERAQQWQDIETAPKDGSPILVKWGGNDTMLVVYWDDEAHHNLPDNKWDTLDGPRYHKDAFSHWQRLPTAPSPASNPSDNPKEQIRNQAFEEAATFVESFGLCDERGQSEAKKMAREIRGLKGTLK